MCVCVFVVYIFCLELFDYPCNNDKQNQTNKLIYPMID